MSKLSSRGPAWNKIRLQILERDGYICVYCGNEGNTVDHVIPKDAGGEDTVDNLVTACNRCNGQKTNKILHRNNWFNSLWMDSL